MILNLLDAKFGFWKKFAMTAFYSLTTVGIVIGICTYTGEGESCARDFFFFFFRHSSVFHTPNAA